MLSLRSLVLFLDSLMLFLSHFLLPYRLFSLFCSATFNDERSSARLEFSSGRSQL
jgi:hypothetical protein